MPKLGTFEGHDVVAATVKITKAGDGLSSALKLDPVQLGIGDEVHVVLRGVVRDVIFTPTKDDPDDRTRVHVVVTDDVALVAAESVSGLLETNRERLRRLKDELAGAEVLPFPPGLLDEDDVPDVIRDNLGSEDG